MNKKLYPQNPVLIIDDDTAILESQDSLLRSYGINNVISINDSRKVMDIMQNTDIEIILLDLTMPHISGEELIVKIHDEYPQVPIIIITGTNEVKTAVECMKIGAFDYMVKAVEDTRLISSVKRAIQIRELKREYRDLSQKMMDNRLNNPSSFSTIITNNKKMLSIFLYIESAAITDEPVLITGETGTGKELIANVIHKVSNRQGQMVSINAAGLDDNIFSDTLWGHSKGAFTGADLARSGLIHQASGGTVLLDEIGDLSLASQIKLLRFLDTGEYYPLGSDLLKRSDARIIAATNNNLIKLIEDGKFRKDLYYRLITHEIRIPPLRERKDDIPFLFNHFYNEACKMLSKKMIGIPQQLTTLLEVYEFPGNVRELRSMIYDAVSKQGTKMLSLEPFRKIIGNKTLTGNNDETESMLFNGQLPTISRATDMLLREAMKKAKGNKSIAAEILGISHQALSKRLIRKKKKN